MATVISVLGPEVIQGLLSLSLTLTVVSAYPQLTDPCSSSLLPFYSWFTKTYTVLAQSRRLQTPVLHPRQGSRSEAMGSDTPTVPSFAPERETGI